MSLLRSLRILFLEDNLEPLIRGVQVCIDKLDIDPDSIIPVYVNKKVNLDDLFKSVASRLGPANWREENWKCIANVDEFEELIRRIGELYNNHAARCHIVILDLQLTEYSNSGSDWEKDVEEGYGMPLLEGVIIAQRLYRDYGARYLVWRTKWADALKDNITGQVLFARDGNYLIETPRAFLVEVDNQNALINALRAIHNDIFNRLATQEVEWRISPYQLTELYRNLTSRMSTIGHLFQKADKKTIDNLADFELIPLFDPPAPLALWLQTKGCNYLELARQDEGEDKKKLGDEFKVWLDENLWGLPISSVEELLNKVKRDFLLSNDCVFEPVEDRLNNSYRLIDPCIRSSLIRAIGNAIKNASENKKEGSKVKILPYLLPLAGVDRFMLVIANELEDTCETVLSRISDNERRRSGLNHIHRAVADLNDFAKEYKGGITNQTDVKRNSWNFQFGLWKDGNLLTGNLMTEEPLRVPSNPAPTELQPPSEICEGTLNLLQSLTGSGEWATAIFVGPVSS